MVKLGGRAAHDNQQHAKLYETPEEAAEEVENQTRELSVRDICSTEIPQLVWERKI